MSDRISPVTIVKQGHANWVVLTAFFVGEGVGAIVALAVVILLAQNSMTSKEALGREARTTIAELKE